MPKIGLVLNGEIKDKRFHKKVLSSCDFLVCADGGMNSLAELGFVPDYLLGDFDSISPSLLRKVEKNGKTKVIHKTDQDDTDFQATIKLINKLSATLPRFKNQKAEVLILGAAGLRADHSFANFICLNEFEENIRAKILDKKHVIQLVKKNLEIDEKDGKTVSIIPLTEVEGLTYQNLKWLVKDKKVGMGWLGVCNLMTGKKASISLSKGMVLVIQVKN